MDEERTLLSIANTYASSMTQRELDLWKQLLKDSTDRRAYRISTTVTGTIPGKNTSL